MTVLSGHSRVLWFGVFAGAGLGDVLSSEHRKESHCHTSRVLGK